MVNTDLTTKKCLGCEKGQPPLTLLQAVEFQEQVPTWEIRDNHSKLINEYKFRNFKQAFDFVSKVADIANAENHHPDIAFGWGYVQLVLTTHDVGGLSENDFIVAAKIDKITA